MHPQLGQGVRTMLCPMDTERSLQLLTRFKHLASGLTGGGAATPNSGGSSCIQGRCRSAWWLAVKLRQLVALFHD